MVVEIRCAGSAKNLNHSEVVLITTTPPLAYAVLSQNTPSVGTLSLEYLPCLYSATRFPCTPTPLNLASVGISLGVNDVWRQPVELGS
jgi:hypothetical protein